MKIWDHKNEALFEHHFWLQILGDHSRFILGALAEEEKQNIQKAKSFIHLFDKLLEQSRMELGEVEIASLNNSAYNAACQIRTFKLDILEEQLAGKIKINIPPTFINHMVNEVEEYIFILAYVEGDKKYTETFSTMLASRGFVVLSINYELFPEAKYPTPVKQVEEFYNHIINVKSEYSIDETKLFFAGDSAGAQIAGQFIAIQTNKELAEDMEMQQIIPLNSIKGTLLYCGPYDVNLLGNSEGNYLFKFLLNQSTWNYIGGRNLKDSQEAREFSVVDNITEDFPPSFITDGNTSSFENHARELIKTLKEKNIEVEELFFSKDQYITEHDYQFILNTEPANIAFNNTINFLERCLK